MSMQLQSTPRASWQLMWALYVVPLIGGLGALTWAVSTFGFSTRMHLDSVVASVLPGCALVVLLKLTNRRLQLAWGHVVAMVGWGFLTVSSYAIASAIAADLLLTSAFGIPPFRAADMSIAVVGPMVEEASKALGVLWAFAFLPRRSWLVAGFFYASLIGVGFATLENVSHYNSNGVTWHMLGARLPGYFSHPLYTSCFALMLGMVWADDRRWLKLLMGVLGWLLSSGLHMTSNMSNVSDADSIHARDFSPVLWLAVLFVMSRLNATQIAAPSAQAAGKQ
jgi:RsiW-degrading membrane proteinase PrsW (M82 family)